jgi:hypothetical protein
LIRLLADENIDAEIISGVLRRCPQMVFESVRDVGLAHTPDPVILEWCAANGFILVTYDRNTVPKHAYERLQAGMPMPGVFVVRDRAPLGEAVLELSRIASQSTQEEWAGLVVFLPVRR